MFNWASFLTYVFVATFTPGPNNLLSLSNSSKVGFKKNLILTLGMLSGITVIMLLCSLFSTFLYEIIPNVKIYLQIICCVYMVWLIIKLWIPHKGGEDMERGNGFFTGMILQLINVKLYLYAFTTMSVYILPFYSSIWTIILFALCLSLTCFISINSWGLFGHFFKKIFDKYPIVTNIILSLLLAYCAVSIFQ